MRICRYTHARSLQVGLYADTAVVPLHQLAVQLGTALPQNMADNLLDYLPPDGPWAAATEELDQRWHRLADVERRRWEVPLTEVALQVPVPSPNKVILLAGNYAEHIRERGGVAVERQETFPYFFWKPPTTTLTRPGDPVRLPAVSPNTIDWEVELAVIIGSRCRNVGEAEALHYVAGYSICNDISDRRFQLNPDRKERDRDRFFDWLHGKWHDTFLPMGPCIRSAGSVADPQQFPLRLRVNGTLMQDGNSGQMIFPVAALIAILSEFMTLEAGDIISTGTPSGVGHGRKPPIYLHPGDVMEAEIEGIGLLRNPVV